MSMRLLLPLLLVGISVALPQRPFGLSGLLGPPRQEPERGREFSSPTPENSHDRSKKTRRKHAERVDVLDEIRGLAKGGGGSGLIGTLTKTLDTKQWKKTARKFCRRFPGHEECRRGHLPDIAKIGTLVESAERDRGKYLPRIRKIKIKDPLEGVNENLKTFARKFSHRFGEIDEDARKKLRGICKRRKCREQSEESKQKKKLVLNKIFEFENDATGKDTTDAIQLRIDRTHQIKQALLEKANLTDEVTAADDGIFDKDLLLTEDQQTFLLNELGKGGEGTDEIPPPPESDDEEDDTTKAKRKKRASIFFEQNLVQMWDIRSPIPYTFDDSLDQIDRNDVVGALTEIQQKTCIRFQYVANPSSHHIRYYKVDSPTFCGLSYVGRADPANPIYLSFQCGNSRGVALHETMHALGVAHQHLRMDRDQSITVDWSNINPQYYDSFAVVDAKIYTTYGVKYDYSSIMHYNAYTAAIDISKPTMIPKVNPASNLGVLGQRDRMSANDVLILQKMYCTSGCQDTNVYCGAWALQNVCTAPNNAGYMNTNCKKSCDLCSLG